MTREPARLVAALLLGDAAREELPRFREARVEAAQRERAERGARERAEAAQRKRDRAIRRSANAEKLEIAIWVTAFGVGLLGGLLFGSAAFSNSGDHRTANKLVVVLLLAIFGGPIAYSVLAEMRDTSRHVLARPFTFVGRAVIFVVPFWLVVMPGVMVGWGLSKL